MHPVHPIKHEVWYFESIGELYKKLQELELKPAVNSNDEVVINDDNNSLIGRWYPTILSIEAINDKQERFLVTYTKNDPREPGEVTVQQEVSYMTSAWVNI